MFVPGVDCDQVQCMADPLKSSPERTGEKLIHYANACRKACLCAWGLCAHAGHGSPFTDVPMHTLFGCSGWHAGVSRPPPEWGIQGEQ